MLQVRDPRSLRRSTLTGVVMDSRDIDVFKKYQKIIQLEELVLAVLH